MNNEYIIGASLQFKHIAIDVANLLSKDVVPIDIVTFSDGEHSVQYKESLRGKTLFLLASTSHDNLIETLLLIDAAKRNAAEKIILVTPYLGYARQDRKEGVRGPLGAKLVADCLSIAGINEIIILDLHAAQIQGFFNIPIDHLEGYNVFVPTLQKMIGEEKDWLICTPDGGGWQRAAKFSEKLGLSMVAINKHRDKPNSIGSMELVGDVKGKKVIIIDDIVDTAGTLAKASNYLLENGALEVHSVCTHAILSGKAIENLRGSNLKSLIISNSNMTEHVAKIVGSPPVNIKVVSIAKQLANAIRAIAMKQSLAAINA